jgi:hypothetical protein
MNPIKIALIDSGVNINHREFINEQLNGFSQYVNKDGIVEIFSCKLLGATTV